MPPIYFATITFNVNIHSVPYSLIIAHDKDKLKAYLKKQFLKHFTTEDILYQLPTELDVDTNKSLEEIFEDYVFNNMMKKVEEDDSCSFEYGIPVTEGELLLMKVESNEKFFWPL